jgi:hypothetical protein
MRAAKRVPADIDARSIAPLNTTAYRGALFAHLSDRQSERQATATGRRTSGSA